eukprot:6179906-Pleurochrysis_carterae.AAC.1
MASSTLAQLEALLTASSDEESDEVAEARCPDECCDNLSRSEELGSLQAYLRPPSASECTSAASRECRPNAAWSDPISHSTNSLSPEIQVAKYKEEHPFAVSPFEASAQPIEERLPDEHQ